MGVLMTLEELKQNLAIALEQRRRKRIALKHIDEVIK